MREDTSILYDKIIELEEEIATLRAENLELRTEEEDESEPYRYAQQIIESKNIDEIQTERKRLWQNYFDFFETGFKFQVSGGGIRLPKVPEYATNNAHMFYLLFPDLAKRSDFIAKMKAQDVSCVFHYLPLHSSEYYKAKHDGRALPNCDRYADTLVRLPLYYGLAPDQEKVFAAVRESLSA